MFHQIAAFINPELNIALSIPLLMLFLAVIGFGVGLLSGLFGIGGGFIVVPLINILLGIPIDIAVGSTASFISGITLSGMLSNMKKGVINFKFALFLGISSIAGSYLGDTFQKILRNLSPNDSLYDFSIQIFILFINILLLAVIYLDDDTKKIKEKININYLGLIMSGLFIGVITGLVGTGGGIFLIPILLKYGMSHMAAAGTSLFAVFCSSSSSVLVKSLSAVQGHEKISIFVVSGLILGSVLGVKIGVWICHEKIDRRKFIITFSTLLIGSSVLVIIKIIDDLIKLNS